jgi:hypothetical protein
MLAVAGEPHYLTLLVALGVLAVAVMVDPHLLVVLRVQIF